MSSESLRIKSLIRWHIIQRHKCQGRRSKSAAKAHTRKINELKQQLKEAN